MGRRPELADSLNPKEIRPSLVATSGGTLVRMEQSSFRPDQEATYQGANHGWQKFIGNLERVVAGLH